MILALRPMQGALGIGQIWAYRQNERQPVNTDSGSATVGQRARGSDRERGEHNSHERAAAAELLRMIYGNHISRAVYVVAELGIADLLADRPMSAAQLAQATGTHERSLYRVLRLLVALGVLREEQDVFLGLTVVGDLLRSDVEWPCQRGLISKWQKAYQSHSGRRSSSIDWSTA